MSISGEVRISYAAFGLRLTSNIPIPGLTAIGGEARTDVEVCLNSTPAWHTEVLIEGARRLAYVSLMLDERGEPVYRLWEVAGGRYFHLCYSNGTEFVIDRSGTRLWARWPQGRILEDVTIPLQGPVLGFVMTLRGVTCLHASVIAVDGRAVALLGPAGAGKSTTAAALALQGHAVLSDDVAALLVRDGRFLVQPAYPSLRLWPDSVAALYGTPDALPRITPGWDKRSLGLTGAGYCFQAQPLPLAAVYVLAPRRADDLAPWVEPLTGQAALIQLLGNTYASHLLPPQGRTAELGVLGPLARSIRMRQAVPHTDARRLQELCRVILDDCRPTLAPLIPAAAEQAIYV